MDFWSKYEKKTNTLPMVTEMQETVLQRLGYGAAESEWHDPKKMHSQFIEINSYKAFADPSIVLLVGRIGTGKTAIVNNLKYLIDNGYEMRYKSATTVTGDKCQKYFFDFSSTIRGSEYKDLIYAELESCFMSKWEWLVNVVAMQEIYKRHSDSSGKCEKIKKYLRENNLIKFSMSANYILDTISSAAENINGVAATVTVALSKTMRKLTSVEYSEALEELQKLLKTEGSCLVLIDSIRNYHVEDKISLAIISALYNVAVMISDDIQNTGIHVKMALPSEIMPHLTNVNTEKMINRTVYIRWNQRNLTELIAVRLYMHKHHDIVDCNLCEAMEYFQSYYTPTCKTAFGITFNTMAYCLMHTQKKPRQLISIFNSWLFLEEKRSGNKMDLIYEATKLNQELQLKGVFQIYANVHIRAFDMFKRAFNNSKYCFNENELDVMIKQCAGIRGDMDAYDVKKLFFASGLLGMERNLHPVDENDPKFKNDRPIRIKEAVFEYQIKDTLTPNNRTRFALHPMVYAHMNIEIDENTLVYPKPNEDEDEFVPWSAE